MKKLIILFLITFSITAIAQTVDTTVFRFKRNSSDGKYSMLENKITYYGKSAGSVLMPVYFNVPAVDTSIWRFIRSSSDTTFRVVENKATFLGKDSGTVRGILIYDISSDTVYYAANMNGYAYKDSSNTFTGSNTFTNISVDTIKSNSTTITEYIADGYGTTNVRQIGTNFMTVGDNTSGLFMGWGNANQIGYGFIDGSGISNSGNSLDFNVGGSQIFKVQNSNDNPAQINILEGSYLQALNGDGGIKTDNIWLNTYTPINTTAPQTVPTETALRGNAGTSLLGEPAKWFIIKDENGTEYLVPAYINNF